MDNKRTKFIIKIAIAIVIGIIIMAGRCSQSKAASEFGVSTQPPTPSPTPETTQIFITPDPNASWDDYISANPILTPEPYVPDTAEPSPAPSDVPMMGTNPSATARFTAYRFAPEVENGEVTYYYQKLIPNYNLYTSYQGNYSTTATQNNGWYQWNAASASNGHFQINENCGIINLVDTYICAWWNIYFSSSQAVGSGLDYGTEVTIFTQWPLDIMDYHTQQLVSSIPVTCVVYVWLDNGEWVTLDPVVIGSNDLLRGHTVTVKSNFENRKVYRISPYYYIGLSYEAYQNLGSPNTRDAARTYLVTNNYQTQPFICHAYVTKNPSWMIGDKIFNFIQTIPGAIGSAIQGLFLPTSNDLNAWVQSHLSSSLESGSPVNRYWEFYLALCNKFINPTYNLDPYLVMPSFSFNVNGQKQTIWQEQRFRLKDADIPFSDGTTLFYWVRLATSIIIVSHWIGNFAYGLFQRCYHIYESAPVEDFEGKGGESRGGGVGR